MISHAFTTNSSCKLDVLRHDCDSLSVYSTQISIFEKTNHVCLSCFLKCKNRLRLESEIRFVLCCDFTNKSLER